MLMEVCGFGILQKVNGMILALLLVHKGIKGLKGKLVQPVHKVNRVFQVTMGQMVQMVKMVHLVQKGIKEPMVVMVLLLIRYGLMPETQEQRLNF